MNDTPGPLPSLSWCGSTDRAHIVLSTYDVTHSSPETWRGVTNYLSVQKNRDLSGKTNLYGFFEIGTAEKNSVS
ncbi:hypothetical protein E2320_005460 [Naja naja]|nr:hypothetical protein E2320_005460 [Naja naja]